jgi:hypothetical protein
MQAKIQAIEDTGFPRSPKRFSTMIICWTWYPQSEGLIGSTISHDSGRVKTLLHAILKALYLLLNC